MSPNNDFGNTPKSKNKKAAVVVLVLVVLLVAAIVVNKIYKPVKPVTNQGPAADNGAKIIKVNFTAPAGFPDSFPLPPNSTNLNNATYASASSTQLQRLFENSDSIVKISAFYDAYFADKTHGWTVLPDQPKNPNPKNKMYYVANKDGSMLINISPMGSSSLIGLNFNKITSNK